MRQYFLFMIFILGFYFLLRGQELSSEKIIREERLSEVILENDLLRLRISEQGGRICSLFDRHQQLEFCDSEQQTFSGLAKIRDILFNNIETVTGRYHLELDEGIPGRRTVRATFLARSGNMSGMQIMRTYTLEAATAYVEGQVLVKCLENDSSFQLNVHNLFPTNRFSTGNLQFYIPTKRGLASFDHAAAALQRLNLALDPAEPWCAFLDQETACGLALQLGSLKQLEGLYVWGQNDAFTLEANYKDVQLKPVAAADEWEMSFRLLPLRGLKQLCQVNNYGAFAAEKMEDHLYVKFLSAVQIKGRLTLWQNDKKLAESEEQAVPAGAIISLKAQLTGKTEPYSMKLQTENFQAKALWTDEKQKKVPLEKQLPKKECTGVNGFYYYFPELWLSAETPTEISFGLRGDFRQKPDFRFVIDLPDGAEIQYSRAEILQSSRVTLNGKNYNRIEIHSSRTSDYFSAIILNLQLQKTFQDGVKAYVQALWKDGGQIPQEITLRQASPLPDIGSGLRYLKIGVENDADKDAWPHFRRFGINSIMVSNWGPPLILYDYKGKGYLEKRIRDLKEAGLFPIYGAGDPYCNIDRVMKQLKPYYTGAGTLYHPEERYEAIDLEQARAVDINGNQILYPCPSFHGPLLAKAVDSLKSLIDYGFDHVCYDEEMWGNGNTLCFCHNCKTKFASFLKDRYPGLVYVDPAVATLQPEQYAAIYDAWWDFKTDQVAHIYKILRETMETYQPDAGVKRQIWVWVDCSVNTTGRYGAITNRLTDYAKIGKYADLLLPMIYTHESQNVGRITGAGGKLLSGVPGHIGAGISPNRTYEYYRVAANNLASMDAVRQQLLEAFFNGGQAVIIWASNSSLRGAYDYFKIAQAVQMLLPVEEILYRGQLVETVYSSNPEVKVTAWQYQDKMALFVRNYEAGSSKTILTLPKEMKLARNTLSQQTYEVQGSLELSLEDDPVMVFLLQ